MTTNAEMQTLLSVEVKSLDDYLDAADYENACDDASRETGWAFPVTDTFKIYWQKERAKRALFFYLLTESAHKFKYKQINLQHRFEHHKKIIEYMDEQFLKAQKERPDQFADVDVYRMFGTKIDAGFQYEQQTGRDTSYGGDNEVIFAPGSSS